LRVAFTIIYNGLNHLKNANFAEFMAKEFDYWVIVEGHAKPGGSTNWCYDLKIPVRSTDGCHEYLLDFSKAHDNVIYYSKGGYWESKDEQVNKAIQLIRKKITSCILWQVDIDEVWTSENLEVNEMHLKRSRKSCGKVQFNHIVGEMDGSYLVARGRWGSSFVNRVWNWNGEDFLTHEPAEIKGQRTVNLPRKFDHFSMYFKEDIIFKEKYYGYENLYENWQDMHQRGRFPMLVSRLLDIKEAKGSRIYKQLRRQKERVLL